MTTNIVFILFVVEILMILAYMYLPYLFSIAMQQNSIPLLKKSNWLDIHQTIARADQLRNLNPPEGVIQPSFYQNYGLSMWIYLNDQPLSYSGYSQETEIFNYGNGKPKITYYNNTEGEKDRVIVYFTNVTSVPQGSASCINNKFEFRMLKQKWNYFVFNYTTTHADLFVNGVLVKSFPFTNNFPTFSAIDTMTVGTDNGLNGAICNIQFYKVNLTLPQIVNSYNMSMNMNPPINNL